MDPDHSRRRTHQHTTSRGSPNACKRTCRQRTKHVCRQSFGREVEFVHTCWRSVFSPREYQFPPHPNTEECYCPSVHVQARKRASVCKLIARVRTKHVASALASTVVEAQGVYKRLPSPRGTTRRRARDVSAPGPGGSSSLSLSLLSIFLSFLL